MDFEHDLNTYCHHDKEIYNCFICFETQKFFDKYLTSKILNYCNYCNIEPCKNVYCNNCQKNILTKFKKGISLKIHCVHNRIKYSCKICYPSNFCKHETYKYNCNFCSLPGAEIRKQIRKEKKEKEKSKILHFKKNPIKKSACHKEHQKGRYCILCRPHYYCEAHKKYKYNCRLCLKI